MHSSVFCRSELVLTRLAAALLLTLLTSGVAQAQTGITDAFNRPDSSSLGAATSGQSWDLYAGSWGIQGGAAAPLSTFGLVAANAGASNLDVSVRLAHTGNEFWLVLRLQDGANYWRFGRSGGAYVLQHIENNSIVSPESTDFATVMPAAGDVIGCQTRADLIDCRVNGVLVTRTAKATGATATRAGLSVYSSSDTRFDDFAATPSAGSDLLISTSGPAQIDFGAVGSWTTTIRNIGVSAASSSVLVFTPPASVSNISVQGATCNVVSAEWRCTLGSIAASQTVTATLQGTAPNTLQQLVFQSRVEQVAGEVYTSNNMGSRTTQTRAPLAPGTILSDSFNRADGPLGSTDTQQAWSMLAGSMSIVGSAAQTGSSFVLSSVDTFQGSGDLTTTVVAPSSEFWVILRLSDGANYWRFGRWQGQAYQLQRIKANGAAFFTTLATVTPAAGDVVRCVYWLDQLECRVNNVVVARATDDFNQTASRVGYSSYQAPGARFDQLLVMQPPPVTDLGVSVTGPLSLRSGEIGSWSIALRNLGTNSTAGNTNLFVTVPSNLGGTGLSGAPCTFEGSQHRCVIGPIASGGIGTVALSGVAPNMVGTLSIAASTPAVSGEASSSNNAQTLVATVRQQIPSNALIVDTFDRPNSSSLGAADTGQVWTVHSGFPTVISNETVLGSGFVLATLNSGVANADIRTLVTSLASEFWMVVRMSDTQNYWRFGRWQDGPYQLQQIRNNGLGAPSVQVLATVQPAAGDQLTCRTSAFLIECAVNNVAVVRTSDSFNRTATRVGFSGYNSTPARLDEFVVVHQPAGPDLSVIVQAPSVALVNQNHNVLVRVRNNGDSTASSSQLVVTLSAGVTVIQTPLSCSASSQQITCSIGQALSPSVQEDFNFTLRKSQTGSLTANAQAAVANDIFPSDNAAAWSTSVMTPESGIFDSFTRPDTTSGLGSTLTGQAWTATSGTFRIQGNRARAGNAGALATIDTGSAFGTLEVTLESDAHAAGVAFRVVDANNYYRLAADENGNYKITKVVNGVAQNLQYYILRHATPVQAGDLIRVVSRPDDGMFVAVNGRHIIDAGDQQFMHASRWGLLGLNATGAFRSFVWVPQMRGFATVDNFSGINGYPLIQPNSGVFYHWIRWAGYEWTYQNGRARLADNGYSISTLDTSSELGTTTVKVIQPGSGGFIVFRYLENGNYFRFGYENGSAYTVEYLTADHMTTAMPVSVQNLATRFPAANDLIEVRQAANGTVETVVNGVVTHRFVDTTSGFRSTLTGLSGNDMTVQFDDFTHTPLP